MGAMVGLSCFGSVAIGCGQDIEVRLARRQPVIAGLCEEDSHKRSPVLICSTTQQFLCNRGIGRVRLFGGGKVRLLAHGAEAVEIAVPVAEPARAEETVRLSRRPGRPPRGLSRV